MIEKKLNLLFHRVGTYSEPSFEDVSKLNFLCIIKHFSELEHINFRIVATFDDGYLSDYNFCVEHLALHNLNSIHFVVPAFIGKPGYMNRDHLIALHKDNRFIGSHSYNHVDLTSLSKAKLFEELYSSKCYLEDLLGDCVDKFSFPFGKYNTVVSNALKEVGYKSIYYSLPGIERGVNRIIPRMNINFLNEHLFSKSFVDTVVNRYYLYKMLHISKNTFKTFVPPYVYDKIRSVL